MFKLKMIGLSLAAAMMLPLTAVADDIRDMEPAVCKKVWLLNTEICSFAPYTMGEEPDVVLVAPEFKTILLTKPEEVAEVIEQTELTEEQIADLEEMVSGRLPTRILFFRALDKDLEADGWRIVKLDRAEYDIFAEHKWLEFGDGLAESESAIPGSPITKTFVVVMKPAFRTVKRIKGLVTLFVEVPSVSGGNSSENLESIVLEPADCVDSTFGFERCQLFVEDEKDTFPTTYITLRLKDRHSLSVVAEELSLDAKAVAELEESFPWKKNPLQVLFFTETDGEPSAEGLAFRTFVLNDTQYDIMAGHEYSAGVNTQFVGFKLAAKLPQFGHIFDREPFLLKTVRIAESGGPIS